MSRRDQVFQALNSVQHHVYDYIDTRTGQPASSSGQLPPSSSSAHTSGVHRSDSVATLPTYGLRPGAGDPSVPDAVLRAPPGQAQQAADQLPMSRMARGDARDARRAAAALRKEQKQTGQLKKRHTFASANGRIILDIHSTPQRVLTYMGGTTERGRGSMKGKVIVHAQEGERISAIRLKIKAVVRVMIPKAGTPQAPFQLDQADPAREPSTEREVLLLQLETKLYSVPTTALPAGSTSFDPTLLAPGSYEYPFNIELPAAVKGAQLPPSFVLSPLHAQRAPQTKGNLFKLTLPALSSDWATVKWYAKLTVERPGMFRANERIFAPFVYLPPPPALKSIDVQLDRRARLAMEVDNALRRFHSSNYAGNINLESFVEPVSSWTEIKLAYGIGSRKGKKPAAPLANEKSNEEGPGLFSRLLFGGQVEGPAAPTKEVYSLSIPNNPHVFPLRSGIPFVLHRQVEWRGHGAVDTRALSKVPHVVLFQRTNVYGRAKGPVAGTTVRLITDSRQTPDTRPATTWSYDPKGSGKSQQNRRGESWLGIIDLPPTCTPCFDTPVLTLDYYLSVRVGAGQSVEYLHSEPVVVCCPPPRPVQAPAPRPSPSSRPAASAVPAVPNPRFPQSTSLRAPVARKQTSASSKPSSSRLDESFNKMAMASPSNGGVAAANRPAAHSNVHAAGPSSSSRLRPSAPPSPAPGVDEKRALHNHYHAQQQQPTSAQPQTPNLQRAQFTHSTPPSRTNSPAPAGHQSVPLSTAASSRAPSEAGTTEDDDMDAEDSNQWLFHEDELTDLPPSYFEATAADQND